MPVDTDTQMNKLFGTIILQIEKEEVGNRTDTGLGKNIWDVAGSNLPSQKWGCLGNFCREKLFGVILSDITSNYVSSHI